MFDLDTKDLGQYRTEIAGAISDQATICPFSISLFLSSDQEPFNFKRTE